MIRLNDPCGRIRCPQGWGRDRENSLALRDAELWLVRAGKGWMRTSDRELALRPGFCALMRPGGIYDAGHDDADPLAITYIHFDVLKGRAAEPDLPLYRQWPEFFQLDDLDYFDAVTRRLVKLFHRAPEVAARLMEGVLADVLELAGGESLPGTPRPYHRQIQEQVSALRAGAEPLPRVADWARTLNLSPAHFSRVFKEAEGQSPQEFLIQIRLSRARYLLSETDLSISQIADRLNYADVYFFSRQFKNAMGVPPTVFRRAVG